MSFRCLNTAGIQAAEKYDIKGEESTHIKGLPLSRIRLLERGVYKPTAFIVQYVGAKLSGFLQCPVAV